MNMNLNNPDATKLDAALALANLGFHVFPLIQGEKEPLIQAWQHRATRDPEQIKAWWTDPVMGFQQDFNVGISTSRYGSGSALWVVDVDNKGEKRGNDEVVRLEMLGLEFPATFEQITPSGGKHLVYIVDEPVRQGANVLAPGLDIRSRGGFIVGAGSTVQQGRYHVREPQLQPARAPDWYKTYSPVRPGNGPRDRTAPVVPVDAAHANLRARDYLVEHAPVAIEGAGGDHTTFTVACRIKDFGVTQLDALTLLAELWNPRCQPPWTHEDLVRKVDNAYNYGNDAPGSAAPEAQFTPVAATARSVDTPGNGGGESTDGQPRGAEPPLHTINRDHALVFLEGSHVILHETVDEKGRPHRVFLSEQSFKRKFSPNVTQRSTKGKPVTWAEEWLDWSGRREYKGLCFTPEREPRNGYYNLWRGFTCEPKPYTGASVEARRGFDAWMAHLRENVCRRDEALLTWLLTYFAHMVQHPWERPLTTLVFRGTKGVGKNAPIDRVGKLFGSGHYLVAHDGRYLTSNFNGHLDSCLCLVLDEAFWSGNKDAEGKLKGLTTAPEIMIERKSKEPYMIDNLVRLVVIGNEDWLVPASADERRYAVFDVGGGRKQDLEFFEQMRIDLDDRGGGAVLLHFLKNWDLTKAEINRAPVTAALLDQKHASLEPLQQWWLDCLSGGFIVGGDFGAEWPARIGTDRFRSAFRRYITERNVRARIDGDTVLGKALKKIAPGMNKTKERTGPHETIYVYVLPPLAECRAAWENYIGHPMKWEQQ